MADYTQPLQMALSCVSTLVLIHGAHRPATGEEYFLGLPGNRPCRVRGNDDRPLILEIQQRFRLNHSAGERHPWTASTVAYAYRVADEADVEILAFHWHPWEPGYEDPHVHLSYGAGALRDELQRAHLPTGQVSLQEFLLFAIRDFGVEPRRKDYARILARPL